ncbi:MAG: GHKL domain-containing protein [Lachnospiraceae bacterium]|nr:GHKL domain-containing protein [Lachnospiraceae bacterium]
MTDWESLYELVSRINELIRCVIYGVAFSCFCVPFVKRKKYAFAAGTAFSVMLLFLWHIPVVIGNFTVYSLCMIAGLLVLCVLEPKRIRQKIFLAVTFFSVRWLTMAIGSCLYIWLDKISMEAPHFSESMALQFKLFLLNIVINGVFDLTLLLVVSWMVGKVYKYSDDDMNRNEFVLMLLPSLSGLIGYAMMKFYEDNYKADTVYELSEISVQFNLMRLCYYVISLITIIVLIMLYQNIKEKQEEARQKELLNGQIESMKHHIGRVERLYADIRGLRHDMGNHITTLEALYETGADKTAGEYMKELKQKLWLSDFEIKSGNPVTDVILSERRQEALENGISFECNFHYPDSDNINAFDISVILNNALDNAIKAAKYAADKGAQAQIKLYSYVKNDIYMIEMENSLRENEKADEADANGHGYGLLNIQSVARKYCGDMLVERADGIFRLSVMLVK